MRQPTQVLTMSWSPDGKLLANFSSDRNLCIWDVGTGQRQLTITTGVPDPDRIAISWDPESKRVASAGADDSVVIWDATTGRSLQRFVGYHGDICNIAWSPDGRSIAATGFGSSEGSILIWDVESEQIQRTLRLGYRGMAGPLSWSPDGSRIASGAENGRAQIWDANSGKVLLSLPHYSSAQQIAFSPDGQRLATSVRGNRVIAWNAATGIVERLIQGHDRLVNSIAWSPDGKRLVTSAQDGLVKIWNMDRDDTILPQIDDVLSIVLWSPDDRLLAYGSTKKSIIVCDAVTGRRVHELEGVADLNLRQFAWNSDGHYIACPGDDGTIRVWDVLSGKVLNTWMHHGTTPFTRPTFAHAAISWHPDGRRLASMSDFDGQVRIWDTGTSEPIDSFATGQMSNNPGDYDTGLAWSPDGQRLATAAMLHGIKFWDANGWRLLHVVDNDIIQFSSTIAWSPDGRFLAASGSAVAPLKIFDTSTGQAVVTIFGQSAQAALSWDRDGQRLLASDSVGSRLWDAVTGDQLLTLDPSAAWSHDRKKIAAVSDHTIRIRDASAGYKLASDPACRRYRAEEHATRLLELAQIGDDAQAMRQMDLALNLAPDDPLVQARASWFLSTCADPRLRDSARALEFANRAAPSRLTWQTLGIKYPDPTKDAAAAAKLEVALRLVPNDPVLRKLYLSISAHAAAKESVVQLSGH